VTPLYLDDMGRVQAIAPDGEQDALALGWIPASEEQARDFFLAQKYGTTGQAAIAGVEAAASTLTFGASTWLEKAAGVDPEAIAAREKANPLAVTAGETAGVILPLLATGGASAVAQGAKGAVQTAAKATAPALLERAGKAAAKVAMRELPANASLAQRLAAKGLSAAAGGAVQGAGYEVGQLVHEAALGDPNLTAESALARIGMSAATFGAMEGGVGILGTLAGRVAGSVDKGAIREKLASWLGDVEARSMGKAAGGIQTDIKKLRQRLGDEGANELMRDMGRMGLVDVFTTPTTTFERATALMERSGRTMGEVLKSADEIALAERATLADLRAVAKQARAEVLKPLEANPYQREAASRLKSLLDDLETPGAASLDGLHRLRVQNDQALYGMRGTMDPYATAYKEALHDLRGVLSSHIEKGIEKSGIPLDIWKTANREYSVAAEALKFAEKGIERSQGNNIFGLSAMLGGVAGTAAAGPFGGLGTTIATEGVRRFGSGVVGWAAKTLRPMLEGTEGAAVANRTARLLQEERRTLGLAGTMLQRASDSPERAAALAAIEKAKRELGGEIDGALSSILSATPRAAGRAVEVQISRLAADAVAARRLASEPGAMMEALARQTADLSDHAPTVAQAAQLTSARAVAFLASKAPATTLPGLYATKARPSTAELSKFGRYREVVDTPLEALEHAKRGTLTPEHVEALRVVWPALYADIQGRALYALMGLGGKKVPPMSLLMLSMLTGFNLTGALGFNAIAANQAVYARPSEKGPKNAPTPNPNAGALKMANRAQTPDQRLDARMEGT
jgi:hypothetical protein